MKKGIKDFDLKGKKVILRLDLNVPIKDGVISDDNRIIQSIKTIKAIRRKGAKIIILSHLGRVKSEEDMPKYTLEPVSLRLSELLGKKITFINKTRGKEVEDAISNMNNSDIILLENTRYEDLKGNKESKNNKILAKYWASLGDVFINDAFGTSHRKHASNYGIASYLPSGIGYLIENEIKYLNKACNNPKRPYILILGGAKVSDKIAIIDNLVKKADYLLIGGAMAFTFLKASGFSVGKSLIEEDYIDYATKILSKYEQKIILPIDIITENKDEINNRFINEIGKNEVGYDIGKGTIKVFNQYLMDAKTIVWNGPLGYFEKEPFEKGTKRVLEIITNTKATTILGGGDIASAAINLGYRDKITHISTGGGASLEMLGGNKLPGIEIIDDKK